jgi:hypothetical protein
MTRYQRPDKQPPDWKEKFQLAIQTAALLVSIAKIAIDLFLKR